MNIAEKILLLKQDFDEVNYAGKFNPIISSENLKGAVSEIGAISVNDVCSMEHPVKCKLTSKNLFDANVLLQAVGWTETNGVFSGMPQRLYHIFHPNMGNNSLFNSFEPNTEYTFSFKGYQQNPTNTMTLKLFFMYSDGTQSDYVYIYNTEEVALSLTSATGKTVVGLYATYNINETVFIRDLQLEKGITATEYTPYISDFTGIKINQYGKNLFDKNLAAVRSNWTTWVGGYYLFPIFVGKGSTVTLSYSQDLVVNMDCPYTRVNLVPDSSDYGAWLYHKTIESLIRKTATVVATEDYIYLSSNIYNEAAHQSFMNFIGNDLQIELGATATTYEQYIEPTTHQTNVDGTIEGVKSIAPNMTLIANSNGAIINAQYYKDPDIVISQLQQTVALSGGE